MKKKIVLELAVEAPDYESWIYENPEVIKSICQGIKDAKDGKVVDHPSFGEFANVEI